MLKLGSLSIRTDTKRYVFFPRAFLLCQFLVVLLIHTVPVCPSHLIPRAANPTHFSLDINI